MIKNAVAFREESDLSNVGSISCSYFFLRLKSQSGVPLNATILSFKKHVCAINTV